MAYFLKKSKLKKGVYLQIYESYYNKDTKSTSNRSYRCIGYVDELTTNEIPDPVSYYSSFVTKMNEKHKLRKQNKKKKQISTSPVKHLGYFPLKSILNRLDISNEINSIGEKQHFETSLYPVLEAALFANAVNMLSKTSAFHSQIPKLYDTFELTPHNIYFGIEALGKDYEAIIDIINTKLLNSTTPNNQDLYFVSHDIKYPASMPSKDSSPYKNLHANLLLDANLLPIDLKILTDSSANKPFLADLFHSAKDSRFKGKKLTFVAAAHSGFQNVLHHAIRNSYDYIISKPVNLLSPTEKSWLIDSLDYTPTYSSDSKLISKSKSAVFTTTYSFPQQFGGYKSVTLEERHIAIYSPSSHGASDCYTYLISSKIDVDYQHLYLKFANIIKTKDAYQNMFLSLRSKPIFLETEKSIKGHILISYMTTLLLGIALTEKLRICITPQDFTNFARSFLVVKSGDQEYVNVSKHSEIIQFIADTLDLPLTNYYLTSDEVALIANGDAFLNELTDELNTLICSNEHML